MGGGPAKDVLLCALPWSDEETAPVIERLKKRFPALDVVSIEAPFFGPAADKPQDRVPESVWKRATILFTLGTFPANPDDAPKLDLVHLCSAGSNQLANHPLYTDTDVTITTSSGIHGPQISEWVIMTGLVLSHRYNALYELQKKSHWGKGQTDIRNVRDKVGQRIGVLGYGSIGRQVGRVAKAMGMQVIAYTATPKDSAEKKKDRGFIVPGTGDPEGEIPDEWYSGLDKESRLNFLKQDLDWLVISVPLTKETTHFLSADEFKALSNGGKKPAVVTNIARGPIIDQPALIEALKDGTLAGAALDVTDPEPLPEDSPLWTLDNVIITPHISSSSNTYTQRTFQVLEENLVRREKGERLLNVVNRKRGY